MNYLAFADFLQATSKQTGMRFSVAGIIRGAFGLAGDETLANTEEVAMSAAMSAISCLRSQRLVSIVENTERHLLSRIQELTKDNVVVVKFGWDEANGKLAWQCRRICSGKAVDIVQRKEANTSDAHRSSSSI